MLEGKVFMSLQVVSNSNINNTNMVSKPSKITNSDGSAFKVYDAQEKAPAKVKIGVFLTTLIGVAAAMFATFKSKKLPVNSVKDYFSNLVHIKYNKEEEEVEKLVGRLAIGSVGGGLLGGILFDKKENRKAKYREAIIQLIGNIFTPLLCVSLGSRGFEKYLNPKIVKGLNLKGKAQEIPKIISSAGFLVAAIFLGNKVGNFINQKLFNVNDNRKLKLSDMSPHIDDACLALSLVASDSSATISRIIPAALMVAGYSTGVMQERPEILSKSKAQNTPKSV